MERPARRAGDRRLVRVRRPVPRGRHRAGHQRGHHQGLLGRRGGTRRGDRDRGRSGAFPHRADHDPGQVGRAGHGGGRCGGPGRDRADAGPAGGGQRGRSRPLEGRRGPVGLGGPERTGAEGEEERRTAPGADGGGGRGPPAPGGGGDRIPCHQQGCQRPARRGSRALRTHQPARHRRHPADRVRVGDHGGCAAAAGTLLDRRGDRTVHGRFARHARRGSRDEPHPAHRSGGGRRLHALLPEARAGGTGARGRAARPGGPRRAGGGDGGPGHRDLGSRRDRLHGHPVSGHGRHLLLPGDRDHPRRGRRRGQLAHRAARAAGRHRPPRRPPRSPQGRPPGPARQAGAGREAGDGADVRCSAAPGPDPPRPHPVPVGPRDARADRARARPETDRPGQGHLLPRHPGHAGVRPADRELPRTLRHP